MLISSGLKADIVPAVPVGETEKDPIYIYSRRDKSVIENYPETTTGTVQRRTSSLTRTTSRRSGYLSAGHLNGTMPVVSSQASTSNAPFTRFRTVSSMTTCLSVSPR